MSLPRPLRGIVQSWHSRPFYAEAALASRGYGLAYLFVLLAILVLPMAIALASSLGSWVTNRAPVYLNQVPRMVIDHGRLSADVPMPYRMVDPTTGMVWGIIDTAGTPDELPATGQVFLLTATQAVFRRSAVETRTYQFADMPHLEIDSQRLKAWLGSVALFGPPAAYLFMLCFGWVWNVVVALLLAALAELFVRGRAPALDFAARMRLAAVALTPVAILDLVQMLGHWRLPLWWLVSLLVGVAYVRFGVRAATGDGGAAVAAPAAEEPAATPAPTPEG